MIGDMWTIMLKEWKELLFQRSNLRGGWLSLLIMMGVFGVYLPLQTGRSWVESPMALAVWLWVPLFLVSSVVADSFAGERERRTLETLLASRLSDGAILLGKIGAAVGYAWGLTLAMLLVGLVTVNAAFGQGQLLVFPAFVGLGIVVLTLLTSLLVAGAGVLVSLRAATVRQAAQTLSITIMLLLFVPVFGVQVLPVEMRRDLVLALTKADLPTVAVGVAAGLLVVDIALLLAAAARFKRARLILD